MNKPRSTWSVAIDVEYAEVVDRIAHLVGESHDEVVNLMLGAQVNRLRAQATEHHLQSVFAPKVTPSPAQAVQLPKKTKKATKVPKKLPKGVATLVKATAPTGDRHARHASLVASVRGLWKSGNRGKSGIARVLGVDESTVRRILTREKLS